MSQTTTTSARAWSPDVQAFTAEDAIPDALINTITTVSGEVEGDEVAVRVPIVIDDEAHIVPEGEDIPEADPQLAEVVVLTTKVAKLLKVSREQFAQDRAAGILSAAAQRSIITKADAVLVNQVAPTAPNLTPPAGLLHQGIYDAGAVAGDLDALVDLVAALQTNGSNPTHWVLSPTAWASLSKFKTGTGSSQSLLGAGTNAADRLLLDVPVLINNALPVHAGLLVDAADIVSAAGNVLVSQSEHFYFGSDNVAVRVTFRFGACAGHPTRHGTFTVTPPA